MKTSAPRPPPEQPTEHSLWLWEPDEEGDAGADGFRPWLDPYPLPGGRRAGAVVICPGGGYAGRAAHEAGVVAGRFNALGFHAFVAHYSVAPRRHPQPLRDAARAMRLVRRRAGDWGADPRRIALLGFSAGGHLAASLGVHAGSDWVAGPSDIDREDCRPDALVLCYPVISAGACGHAGSFRNLLGPDAPPDLRERMSLERQVTAATPPAFLWHTAADPSVPVENAFLFAQALRRRGVPFEIHVFPEGRHGLGLAPQCPAVAVWPELCARWLNGMGWGGNPAQCQ